MQLERCGSELLRLASFLFGLYPERLFGVAGLASFALGVLARFADSFLVLAPRCKLPLLSLVLLLRLATRVLSQTLLCGRVSSSRALLLLKLRLR